MATTLKKRNAIVPWRFAMFFVVLVAGSAAAALQFEWSKAVLIGFDGAAVAFLVSTIPAFRYDGKTLREIAERNDANRLTLLILSFLLTVVILAAVVFEMGQKQSLQWPEKALIATTLACVWLFANTVYTFHYAHLFYPKTDGGKDCGGLGFPGTREPVFADFAYFSYTLGVAVQTSDVQVTSPHIRNVVTAHCVAGFFFNLGVLALTINVLGSS